MSKIECHRCGSDYADEYFKDEYSDEVICNDCLLEIDGITSNTITSYYLDGEYLGNDSDYDELIETICDNTFYKPIKEDKQ